MTRVLLLAIVLAVAGCDDQSMRQQNRFDTYAPSKIWPNGSEAQPLPAGVVAQGDLARAMDTKQPPPVTAYLMRTGREKFGIFCSPCHGLAGDGDGIVRLVKTLQKEGIRIDGVGMQGHWGLNYPKTKYIEDAIDSFAACSVKVMITELDVDVLPLTKEGQIIGQGMADKQFQLEEFRNFLDPYPNGLPDSMQTELANRYEELFKIFYNHRDKIARVTFWGVHDGMSWKNNYPIPNRTNYPLLWDRQKKAKPALDAVLNVPARIKKRI